MTPTVPARGRLALSYDAAVVKMFVSWPALPPTLYADARAKARAALWRPRLWGEGAFLHPDTALGVGPFALALSTVPTAESPAYPGAADVFGPGSEVAVVLAARTVDWHANLLFDPNSARTTAKQRTGTLTGTSKYAWVAVRSGGATLEGLRKLGDTCGYAVFEANLADTLDRKILVRAGLHRGSGKWLLARHPVDAIGAPQGVVRPNRPFLFYKEGGSAEHEGIPQSLAEGERIAAVSGPSGRPGLRAKPASPPGENIVEVVVFEKERAFEALMEKRLQIRVKSRLLVIDLPAIIELEIDGYLIAQGFGRLAALPYTIPAHSTLLVPLYDDRAREKLLEIGKGSIRITLGQTIAVSIALERPVPQQS
jgi:hypothetical protein